MRILSLEGCGIININISNNVIVVMVMKRGSWKCVG